MKESRNKRVPIRTFFYSFVPFRAYNFKMNLLFKVAKICFLLVQSRINKLMNYCERKKSTNKKINKGH